MDGLSNYFESMPTYAAETAFSELINQPKATVAKLSAVRDLHLRRRDDEDLVLTTAARAEQEHALTSATTRLVAAMVTHVDQLNEVVPEAFPWARFLPADDVHAFVAELVDTLRAAEELDSPAPVMQVITEWKHTAEVHADPELHKLLSHDSSDHGPATVPRPVS